MDRWQSKISHVLRRNKLTSALITPIPVPVRTKDKIVSVEIKRKLLTRRDVINDLYTRYGGGSSSSSSISNTASSSTSTDTTLHMTETPFAAITGQSAEVVDDVTFLVNAQATHLLQTTDTELNYFSTIAKVMVGNYLMYAFNRGFEALFPDRIEHLVIDTPDGGEICVKIFQASEQALKAFVSAHNGEEPPGVYLLPGVNQSDSSFMCTIEHFTDQLGWPVVVLNRRGLCQKLHTPLFQVAGSDADTELAMQEVRKRHDFATRKMFMLCVSMGGMIGTRYLGRYPHNREMDGIIGAMTICSPLRPEDVILRRHMTHYWLSTFFSFLYLRPYQNHTFELEPVTVEFLLSQDQINARYNHYHAQERIRQKMSQCSNVFEFMLLNILLMFDVSQNEAYQVLLEEHGADGVMQLVRANDSRVWMCFPEYDATVSYRRINVPIVALSSIDDFLVNPSVLSTDSVLSSPYATIVRTSAGSHCYYRRNLLDFMHGSWADEFAGNFFHHILEQSRNTASHSSTQ